MELDLTKLGKLIEKCKAAGVSKLCLSDGGGVTVEFGGNEEKESVVHVPVHRLDEKYLKSDGPSEPSPEDKSFEEEMLHLTDPAAWQRNLLDPENDEDSIAVGGDEESEFKYEH